MSIGPNVERPAGFFGSIRRVFADMLGLIQTRLELLSLDIAAERSRLVHIAIVGAGVLICFQSGIVLGVIFLVLVLPEEARPVAVGITGLFLLLLAAGGALWLRRWLRTRPPFFEATITEFRKDREMLRGKK